MQQFQQSATTRSHPTVAICVITYKRPGMLSRALESISALECDHPVEVLVVDNDSDGSAAETVAAHPARPRYVSEPRPGIAAARNAGLAALGHADFVAFIDDDEWCDPRWLRRLLAAQAQYSADVVAGPVIPVLPDDAPVWASQGGYFERARWPSGKELDVAATNNCLLSMRFLDSRGNPRFDEAFGLTGGSDTDFFYRMREQGARIIWCDEAVVYEEVPADRLRPAWVVKRQIRAGNVTGRIYRRERGVPAVLVFAFLRIALGLSTSVGQLVTRRRVAASGSGPLLRGVGMLLALSGSYVQEYRREGAPRSAAASG